MKTRVIAAILLLNLPLSLGAQSARDYFNRGVARQSDYAGAIQEYTNAINADPNYWAAYRNRAECYAQLGRWAEASADLDTAVSILYLQELAAEKNTGNKDRMLEFRMAELLDQRAIARYQTGNLQGALEDLASMASRSANNEAHYRSAHFRRGYIFVEQKRHAEAIQEFDAVLKSNSGKQPDNIVLLAHYNRGLARAAQNDLNGAAQDFGEVINSPLTKEFFPASEQPAYSHLNRARVRVRQGDMAGAMKDFDRMVALAPGDSRGHLERGMHAHDMKRLEQAEVDLTESARLAPQWYAPLYERARVRKDLNRIQDALADINRCLELNPKFSNSYKVRANLRRQLGDETGAAADEAKLSEERQTK